MIRLSSVVWLIVLAFMGVGLFQMKYSVQAQEKQLKSLRRQLAERLDNIHVMEAEWSYLNDPERLAQLVRRNTDLVPVTAAQIGEVGRLPERAPSVAPSVGTNATGGGGQLSLPLLGGQRADTQSGNVQSLQLQEILSKIGQHP
jgi:hypothetical protein